MKFIVNAEIMPKDSQNFGWIALQSVPVAVSAKAIGSNLDMPLPGATPC